MVDAVRLDLGDGQVQAAVLAEDELVEVGREVMAGRNSILRRPATVRPPTNDQRDQPASDSR